MTTNIYDAAGARISTSGNLRNMLRFANGNGARVIDVIKTNVGSHSICRAYVRVHYASGHIAETYFVDHSHALEWAKTRSKASPRQSWFAGCAVVAWECTPGYWCIDTARPNVEFLIHQQRVKEVFA